VENSDPSPLRSRASASRNHSVSANLHLKSRHCDWNTATCSHFRIGVVNGVYED
jgi:hypothetical protein